MRWYISIRDLSRVATCVCLRVANYAIERGGEPACENAANHRYPVSKRTFREKRENTKGVKKRKETRARIDRSNISSNLCSRIYFTKVRTRGSPTWRLRESVENHSILVFSLFAPFYSLFGCRGTSRTWKMSDNTLGVQKKRRKKQK